MLSILIPLTFFTVGSAHLSTSRIALTNVIDFLLLQLGQVSFSFDVDIFYSLIPFKTTNPLFTLLFTL